MRRSDLIRVFFFQRRLSFLVKWRSSIKWLSNPNTRLSVCFLSFFLSTSPVCCFQDFFFLLLPLEGLANTNSLWYLFIMLVARFKILMNEWRWLKGGGRHRHAVFLRLNIEADTTERKRVNKSRLVDSVDVRLSIFSPPLLSSSGRKLLWPPLTLTN